MIKFPRNRKLWIGASTPIALGIAVLVFGVTQGGARAAASEASPNFNASGDAEPTISAASSISALQTTASVTTPASLAAAVSALNASGGPATGAASVGSINAGELHPLLTNVGNLNDSVYAAVTDAGEVCILDAQGPAGCFDQFTSSIPVIWQGAISSNGTWTHITGLAPDRVEGVAIEGDGTTQSAILRNNAFYVEPTGHPTALLLTYRDGTTQTVPLQTQIPPNPQQP